RPARAGPRPDPGRVSGQASSGGSLSVVDSTSLVSPGVRRPGARAGCHPREPRDFRASRLRSRCDGPVEPVSVLNFGACRVPPRRVGADSWAVRPYGGTVGGPIVAV